MKTLSINQFTPIKTLKRVLKTTAIALPFIAMAESCCPVIYHDNHPVPLYQRNRYLPPHTYPVPSRMPKPAPHQRPLRRPPQIPPHELHRPPHRHNGPQTPPPGRRPNITEEHVLDINS